MSRPPGTAGLRPSPPWATRTAGSCSTSSPRRGAGQPRRRRRSPGPARGARRPSSWTGWCRTGCWPWSSASSGAREGPGPAGRPSCTWPPSGKSAASVPDRNYDLAARTAGLGDRGVNGRRRFRPRGAGADRPRRGQAAARATAGAAGPAMPRTAAAGPLRGVPRGGGLPAGGRRRGRPGAAELPVPPDRRRPRRRGLRHERRVPRRGRGRLRHRPGPGAGARHRRTPRAGRRAARRSAAPGSGLRTVARPGRRSPGAWSRQLGRARGAPRAWPALRSRSAARPRSPAGRPTTWTRVSGVPSTTVMTAVKTTIRLR